MPSISDSSPLPGRWSSNVTSQPTTLDDEASRSGMSGADVAGKATAAGAIPTDRQPIIITKQQPANEIVSGRFMVTHLQR